MSPHRHTKACQEPCSREWDLDTDQVTDALKLRKIQRKAAVLDALRNEPPWWTKLAVKAGFKAIEWAGFFVIIAALSTASHCGVKIPGLSP